MSATISLASNSASGAIERSRPSSCSCGSGHADDVEFDIAAARVTRQRVVDPPLDFLDVAGGLCEDRLEVHVASPCPVPAVAAGGRSDLLLGLDLVNGALRAGLFRGCARRMAATETTMAAAKPSVRAGVLAATIVALVTLSIATFELSMADFPSGARHHGDRAAGGAAVLRMPRVVGIAIAAHPQRRREVRDARLRSARRRCWRCNTRRCRRSI